MVAQKVALKMSLEDLQAGKQDQTEENGLCQVEALVHGVTARVFLDSGANICTVKEEFLEKIMSTDVVLDVVEGESRVVKCANG